MLRPPAQHRRGGRFSLRPPSASTACVAVAVLLALAGIAAVLRAPPPAGSPTHPPPPRGPPPLSPLSPLLLPPPPRYTPLFLDDVAVPAGVVRTTSSRLLSSATQDVWARAVADMVEVGRRVRASASGESGDTSGPVLGLAPAARNTLRRELLLGAARLRAIADTLGPVADLGAKRRAGQPAVDLLVAVLSARGHAARRQALRDSWAGDAATAADLRGRVLVRFVVGDTACMIPPADRVDEHACIEAPAQAAAPGASLTPAGFMCSPPTCSHARRSGSV